MNAKPNTDEPLLITFKEAADKLHSSVSAVRRLVQMGLLDGVSLFGKTATRCTMASVHKLIDVRVRENAAHRLQREADRQRAEAAN